LERLKIALRQQANIEIIDMPLLLLKLGDILRESDWQVTVILDTLRDENGNYSEARLVDILSGYLLDLDPVWGSGDRYWNYNCVSLACEPHYGEVRAQVAEYNGQISAERM
jgi:hypothetical protein